MRKEGDESKEAKGGEERRVKNAPLSQDLIDLTQTSLLLSLVLLLVLLQGILEVREGSYRPVEGGDVELIKTERKEGTSRQVSRFSFPSLPLLSLSPESTTRQPIEREAE